MSVILKKGEKESKRGWVITFFRLYLLVAALFSTVAGIMALYGAGTGGVGCRHGLEITAVALQGTALISCVMGLTIAAIHSCRNKKQPKIQASKSSVDQLPKDILPQLKYSIEEASPAEILNGVLQLLAGTGGTIMIVFMLAKNDCGNPTYNTVYSIFSIGGAFLATLITSFAEKAHKSLISRNDRSCPPVPYCRPQHHHHHHPHHSNFLRDPAIRVVRHQDIIRIIRYKPNRPSWSRFQQ